MPTLVVPDLGDVTDPATIRQIYDDLLAAETRLTSLEALRRLFARKSADETVNNSATYQADDHLVVAGAASITYAVVLNMIVNSGTTPDIKVRFTLPAGATATNWSVHLTQSGATATIASMTTGSGVGTAAVDEGLLFLGLIIMSTTAGNIQVDWAQNTANASNTIVRSNSYLLLQPAA
jgi:hypothetical protein